MGYQALYRKYRPRGFESVVGQNHIVQTLRNQIESNRVSHAYLFCGTRGTGKTSTAKIFAKAINCLEPVNGEPCNKCNLCIEIDEGRSMNVIEIDAASNNGVDNIREIREVVQYAPADGCYKVYIIDEVHMLSVGAFNALLKTLEEPPAHAVFILATTDPQKVPVTIHSRCQRFDFRRIPSKEIVGALKEYLNHEGIEAFDDAIGYIAYLADGSMRDSLSILDQCIAFYYGETITLEKVLDVVGAVDNGVFFDTTQALSNKDIKRLMEIVEEIMMSGRDIVQFVNQLIEHLRNILVISSVKKPEEILNMSNEYIERLKSQSEVFSTLQFIYLIKFFSELVTNLKLAENERVLLEVGFFKLCTLSYEDANDYGLLLERISKLENDLKTSQVTVNDTNTVNDTKRIKERVKKRPEPKSVALPKDIENAIDIWEDIKDEFDMSTKSALTMTSIGYLDNEYMYLVCDSKAVFDILNSRKDIVGDKLTQKTGKTFNIKLITKEAFENLENQKYGMEKDHDKDMEVENSMRAYFPDMEYK